MNLIQNIIYLYINFSVYFLNISAKKFCNETAIQCSMQPLEMVTKYRKSQWFEFFNVRRAVVK